jgi:hypothetical protein
MDCFAALAMTGNRRFVCQFATVMRSRLKLWNALGTNRARIADSSRNWLRSPQYLALGQS